jgi:hypothetical protein
MLVLLIEVLLIEVLLIEVLLIEVLLIEPENESGKVTIKPQIFHDI